MELGVGGAGDFIPIVLHRYVALLGIVIEDGRGAGKEKGRGGQGERGETP